MAEIDPVILELRAELGKYRADLKSTTSMVQNQLGSQEKSVQRLEAQMRKSSGAISGQLRGLAATFATYFSGRELVGLIDGFTRVQNSLRVAGLEGQKLEAVQADLLDLSTRYGVSIEGLANLYGKATDAGRSFGASEGEVLKLTEATSQALLITGTNAQQASGAILGLSQALASGTVRAEEYNQINEGGLRPLLQAAAATEKYGGDINKLRSAVLAGKVSSQEFFQAIQAGSAQLSGQAANATLTLSGAFEALTSRLTVYIGQSAEANGVTQALVGAMQLLADNLDTVIPALAIIAALMGASLVGNALAGTRAFFALTAAMGGAATAAEALAFTLGTAGVGAAIVAVGAGLIYLVSQTDNATMSLDDLKAANERNADELDSMISKLKAAGVQTDELAAAADRAKGSVDGLSDSYRQALIEARKFNKETAGGKIQTYNDDIRASQDRQAVLTEYIRAQRAANPGAIREGRKSPQLANAEQKLAAERQLEAGLRVRVDVQAAAFQAGVDLDGGGKRTATATTDKTKPKKPPKGPKDRTEEIAARAAQELAQLQIEELRARAELSTNVEERADFERQILAAERKQREDDLDARIKAGSLTKEQADEQRKIIDALYGQRITEDGTGDIIVEKQKSIYGELQARQEQERLARLQADAMRDELDALGAESDITDVRTARVEIERRMLEIQQDIERKLLEEAIARGDVLDAAQARAALDRKQSADRTGFERDNKGPLGKYIDDAKKVGANLNDEFESIAVDGLQSLNDGLADAIVNSKNLGDVFKNVAKQIIADLIRIAIQQQIVNALQSAFGGGGGGGIFSSLFGGGSSMGTSGGMDLRGFGRASGGNVNAGTMYRVQEGQREFFRPSVSGDIIPLSAMNAQASRGTSQTVVNQTFVLDARHGITTPQLINYVNQTANAKALEAGGASFAAGQQSMPGSLNKYQQLKG